MSEKGSNPEELDMAQGLSSPPKFLEQTPTHCWVVQNAEDSHASRFKHQPRSVLVAAGLNLCNNVLNKRPFCTPRCLGRWRIYRYSVRGLWLHITVCRFTVRGVSLLDRAAVTRHFYMDSAIMKSFMRCTFRGNIIKTDLDSEARTLGHQHLIRQSSDPVEGGFLVV